MQAIAEQWRFTVSRGAGMVLCVAALNGAFSFSSFYSPAVAAGIIGGSCLSIFFKGIVCHLRKRAEFNIPPFA